MTSPAIARTATSSPVSSVDNTGIPATSASKNLSYHLQWSRLTKRVKVQDVTKGMVRSSITDGIGRKSNKKKQQSSKTKTILNEVSAGASPGNVLALIGPSGSGKTTLLNSLSGRTQLDSGTLLVNGTKVLEAKGNQSSSGANATGSSSSSAVMKRFVSQVAYVRQEDIFFEELTVRDQLAYTAFLRLPHAWTAVQKLAQVDHVLKELRLTHVRESPIQLLSGGEKKRVNIGTELLSNPTVLLLDEPTSGLDSTSAVALVKLLQQVAQNESKTVVMSIHQPSSGMFMSFDQLLLLAEGNVVYFGTPQHSIQYLQDHQFPCPVGYNAADHWMDLLVTVSTSGDDLLLLGDKNSKVDEVQEAEGAKATATGGAAPVVDSGMSEDVSEVSHHSAHKPTATDSTRQQLIDAWDGDAVAQEIDASVQTIQEGKKDALNDGQTTPTSKYNTNWWTQYKVLTHRAMKNSRSAIFTPLNMIKSALIGIISGLLWFQLDYTEQTIHDRTSYFFFTMTYWVFDSMFGAILAFPSERKVIQKERASGSYHLSAYFMAKTSSEAPTRLALPLIYMTISFWLAGISSQFSMFVFTTLISLMSVLAGESFGLLVGASIDRTDRALAATTVSALSMMLLGGFYVENVPSFVSWAKYMSPFKYSYDASRALVIDRPVPCDGSGKLQDLCFDGREFAPPDEVKEFMELDGSLAFNVCMLLVLGIVPRYLAYLALRLKKSKDR